MTPPGNQLQRQRPRAPRPAADAPLEPPAPPARAPSPQDTLRWIEADAPAPVRVRPGRATGHRMRLTRRGVVVVVTFGLALIIGMEVAIDALVFPSGPGGGAPATVQPVITTEAASVAFDSTGGWLADDQDGTVRHFETATGAALGRPLRLGGRPISVVSGFGRIWVADIAGSTVWQINPKTDTVVGSPIPVPEGPVALAAGDGGVWVASLVAGSVSLIDPRTDDVLATATLPDGAVRMTIGPGGVWVSGQTDTLTRVDPRPVGGALHWRTVQVGQGPFGVGVGDGSVWVANVKSGSVSRVDPATMRVTATDTIGGAGAGVPANPEMVALWHGQLWVADAQQGLVVALDPATGAQVGQPVQVPGVIRQLVVDDAGSLWGTTSNPGTVVRFSS